MYAVTAHLPALSPAVCMPPTAISPIFHCTRVLVKDMWVVSHLLLLQSINNNPVYVFLCMYGNMSGEKILLVELLRQRAYAFVIFMVTKILLSA